MKTTEINPRKLNEIGKLDNKMNDGADKLDDNLNKLNNIDNKLNNIDSSVKEISKINAKLDYLKKRKSFWSTCILVPVITFIITSIIMVIFIKIFK